MALHIVLVTGGNLNTIRTTTGAKENKANRQLNGLGTTTCICYLPQHAQRGQTLAKLRSPAMEKTKGPTE